MTIKNGAYKLKKHIKNSRPSGSRDGLWTCCEFIPPKDDDEWGFRDPEEFLFVIRDVYVLGRKYREVIYAVAEWSSGFYIDDVPCEEHFSGVDTEDVEEELYGALQHRAEEPAPQDFLDALVPVDRTTLTEILLDYAQYEGIDPRNRLAKREWSYTVFAVLDEMGSADQELLKKFETNLRMLLMKDANRFAHTEMYPDDPKEQAEYETRITQESVELRNKQSHAFHEMHMKDLERRRQEERLRELEG